MASLRRASGAVALGPGPRVSTSVAMPQSCAGATAETLAAAQSASRVGVVTAAKVRLGDNHKSAQGKPPRVTASAELKGADGGAASKRVVDEERIDENVGKACKARSVPASAAKSAGMQFARPL